MPQLDKPQDLVEVLDLTNEIILSCGQVAESTPLSRVLVPHIVLFTHIPSMPYQATLYQPHILYRYRIVTEDCCKNT